MAGSVEDVLGDVERSLITFGAEVTAFTMDIIRVCIGGAVGRVAGESFHGIERVVVGKTRIRYNFLASEETIRGRKNAFFSIFSYSIVREGMFSFEGFSCMKLRFSGFGCRLMFLFI